MGKLLLITGDIAAGKSIFLKYYLKDIKLLYIRRIHSKRF